MISPTRNAMPAATPRTRTARCRRAAGVERCSEITDLILLRRAAESHTTVPTPHDRRRLDNRRLHAPDGCVGVFPGPHRWRAFARGLPRRGVPRLAPRAARPE